MLHELTVKKNIRTFSVCPENLTGEKGMGGRAVEGTASYAARHYHHMSIHLSSWNYMFQEPSPTPEGHA